MTGSWKTGYRVNEIFSYSHKIRSNEKQTHSSTVWVYKPSTWALVVSLHRFFCVKTKRMKWFLNLVGLVAILPLGPFLFILCTSWSRVSDRCGFIITNHFPVCRYLLKACEYLLYIRCHCDIDYRFFKPTKCSASQNELTPHTMLSGFVALPMWAENFWLNHISFNENGGVECRSWNWETGNLRLIERKIRSNLANHYSWSVFLFFWFYRA